MSGLGEGFHNTWGLGRVVRATAREGRGGEREGSGKTFDVLAEPKSQLESRESEGEQVKGGGQVEDSRGGPELLWGGQGGGRGAGATSSAPGSLWSDGPGLHPAAG